MVPLIAAVLPVVTSLLDKFIPDTAARDKAKAEAEMTLLQTLAAGDLAQQEVNKIEAANANIFVSGWRPAIGWCCALALFWNYLGYPLAIWACAIWWPLVTPPALVNDSLFELVLAMLGLGGMRTYEKLKGIAK